MAKRCGFDFEHQLLGFGQLLLVIRVEGIAEIFERIADGGELIVMHHHAPGERALGLVPEFLPARRLLRHILGIDHKAGGAPVLRHRIDRAVDRAFRGEARSCVEAS